MPLADTTEASKKFDRLSFADWMLKEKKYHPAVKAYVDLYCRSAFGAPAAEHLSAFAGLNFYVSEFSDRYTFPGGNALAAELLRDSIDAAGEHRILANATAVEIQERGGSVIVTYLDKAGRPAAVEAKVVVVASPKYIARHIVKGLPKDQAAAIDELTYGSYVVANVLCSSPVAEGSYDTWTDVAPFTDFIVADWITRGPDQRARTRQQVLTVYYPVAYQAATLLTDDAYDTYRDAVVEHLGYLYPGAESKIEDVRLYRWGHALCHARPGWYTQRSPLAARPMGRILFAHSDNQGLPAFEAALVEGMLAAEAAREMLG
jgi:protoporphyrinogen oxidase